MTWREWLGDDPWIGVVVGDSRAALAASEQLDAAEKRLDGPFDLWEGRAGAVPVTLAVAGSPERGSWHAAARLLIRRVNPTVVVGVGAPVWLDDGARPDMIVAAEVVSPSPEMDTFLSNWEATATGGVPERLRDAEPSVEGLRRAEASPAATALARALETGDGDTREGLNANTVAFARVVSQNKNWVEGVGAARWIRNRLHVSAAARGWWDIVEAVEDTDAAWCLLGCPIDLRDPKRVARDLLSPERSRREETQAVARAVARLFGLFEISSRSP